MTRVLVAGAAGFIGRHMVARLLAETDWHVIALARWESSHADVPADERVTWVHADLAKCDPAALAKVIGDEVQYVVNLAADADAARSLTSPADVVANNVALTSTLLDYARGLYTLRRFIQVSSAEVFGTLPWEHKEDEPPRPQTPYAASKAAQDALVLAYREAYGLPGLVSYTANVFGEGQPRTKLLPVLAQCAQCGDRLEVIGGERRFIHAQDCASAWLWMLLEAPVDWTHCNVAGEWRMSHAAFAQLIARQIGRPHVSVRIGGTARPGQDGDILLDGSRLAEAGWRHPLGLERGVRQTLDALREYLV